MHEKQSLELCHSDAAVAAMYTTTTRRHECAATGNENLKVVFENIATARSYYYAVVVVVVWCKSCVQTCSARMRYEYVTIAEPLQVRLLWFNELRARTNFIVLRYRHYTQFPFTHTRYTAYRALLVYYEVY